MDIVFESARDRALFNDRRALTRRYGKQVAEKIAQRLDDVRAAEALEDLRGLPGRWHELTGDRVGQVAAHLTANLRLVVEVADDPLPRRPNDAGLDWAGVTTVRVVEVVDYHG